MQSLKLYANSILTACHIMNWGLRMHVQFYVVMYTGYKSIIWHIEIKYLTIDIGE